MVDESHPRDIVELKPGETATFCRCRLVVVALLASLIFACLPGRVAQPTAPTPTKGPTKAPVVQPTAPAPTMEPTKAPVVQLTAPAPTMEPTKAPVAAPTVAPPEFTAAPVAPTPPQAIGPQAVSFTSEDGVPLSGTFYGKGKTVVILSHMYPTDQKSWATFAQILAQDGYAALTYDFRGYGQSGGKRDVSQIDKDLRGAVAFARKQGAERIVLVGASMGGTATVKVAAVEDTAAVVVISAPDNFQGLSVSVDEVRAIKAPKLFIGSEGDGATKTTLIMFDQAYDPKKQYIYPGNAHGTFIFDTENGDDLIKRLLGFIETNAPPSP
jgi:dienelactone hydrolase